METSESTIRLPESVAYEEEMAHQEDVEAIRMGIAECEQGKALLARVALEELRQRHGISYGR